MQRLRSMRHNKTYGTNLLMIIVEPGLKITLSYDSGIVIKTAVHIHIIGSRSLHYVRSFGDFKGTVLAVRDGNYIYVYSSLNNRYSKQLYRIRLPSLTVDHMPTGKVGPIDLCQGDMMLPTDKFMYHYQALTGDIVIHRRSDTTSTPRMQILHTDYDVADMVAIKDGLIIFNKQTMFIYNDGNTTPIMTIPHYRDTFISLGTSGSYSYLASESSTNSNSYAFGYQSFDGQTTITNPEFKHLQYAINRSIFSTNYDVLKLEDGVIVARYAHLPDMGYKKLMSYAYNRLLKWHFLLPEAIEFTMHYTSRLSDLVVITQS